MCWPRERLLTAMARPLIPIDFDHYRDQFCWRSDHQLLLLTTQGDIAPVPHEDYLVQTVWHGSADLFDISTRARTHLPGLTNLLNRDSTFPVLTRDSLMSPDGRWCLWRVFETSDFSSPRMAYLDGTHYHKWPGSPSQDDLFLDADHFLQMRDSNPRMIVRELRDPVQAHRYRDGKQAEELFVRYAVQHPVYLAVPQPNGVIPGDRAEIDTYRSQDRLPFLLSKSNPRRKAPKPIETRFVPLPESATFYRGQISPQQQSVLYDFRMLSTHPFLAWLHKAIPGIRVKPRVTEELWVSRADGQGMHEIGHISMQTEQNNDLREKLMHVDWLPNGKQISFVYRGMLYVVSAK